MGASDGMRATAAGTLLRAGLGIPGLPKTARAVSKYMLMAEPMLPLTQ